MPARKRGRAETPVLRRQIAGRPLPGARASRPRRLTEGMMKIENINWYAPLAVGLMEIENYSISHRD
jgi:hypothetical protein